MCVTYFKTLIKNNDETITKWQQFILRQVINPYILFHWYVSYNSVSGIVYFFRLLLLELKSDFWRKLVLNIQIYNKKNIQYAVTDRYLVERRSFKKEMKKKKKLVSFIREDIDLVKRIIFYVNQLLKFDPYLKMGNTAPPFLPLPLSYSLRLFTSYHLCNTFNRFVFLFNCHFLFLFI